MSKQELGGENKDYEKEVFKDGSNNEMRLLMKRGKYAAFELLSEDNQEHSGPAEKGKGYITDTEYSDIWPGPIMSWFGKGERFSTPEQALDYYTEYEEEVKKVGEEEAQKNPRFREEGVGK